MLGCTNSLYDLSIWYICDLNQMYQEDWMTLHIGHPEPPWSDHGILSRCIRVHFRPYWPLEGSEAHEGFEGRVSNPSLSSSILWDKSSRNLGSRRRWLPGPAPLASPATDGRWSVRPGAGRPLTPAYYLLPTTHFSPVHPHIIWASTLCLCKPPVAAS